MTRDTPPPPQAFLLVTIPDCRLVSSTSSPPDTQGTLGIVCVTLDIDSFSGWSQGSNEDARDVWLLLRIGSIEIPISPTETILYSRMSRTYTFVAAALEGSPRITVAFPPPSSPAEGEDIETFNIVLSQYGIVQQIDPDPYEPDGDLKGRLVLVDQNDGGYVGTLRENIQVQEHPNLETSGKNPVVAEYDENAQTLYVHSVTPQEQDWLLRSADYLSRGIVLLGDAIASGLNYASTQFVNRTAPTQSPITFSDRAKRNVNRVHMLSGHAVQASSKTVNLIHGAIDRLAIRWGRRSPSPSPGPPGGPNQSSRPARKPGLKNRVLASTDMILTAAEQSVSTVLKSGTTSLSAGVGHMYGPDAGKAVEQIGETAQNVSLVYVDARGVGRRALLKRMGKGVLKAQFGRDKTVVFGDTLVEPPALPPTSPLRSAYRSGYLSPSSSSTAPTFPSLPPR
ncbi:senescence-associated protein-domain-containing protein [Cantharellus anzutake]|uniref:senescence-associated protein-domain-containing protein n=1 Tax=Cantharellus anzutake TaxID=1750568 RepID=UPI001905E013|nr:senescence-associated protein-domain-containing protein [Cantharellus anzutake]KAF8344017.1 senescence-associated protein-domain-containing protein [Cantharellus anzutake]